YHLACDLGAESGRLMLGTLNDGLLALKEVHRFANGPVRRAGALHWDLPWLFEEIKVGLTRASDLNLPVSSISTDSWGVDYALFDDGDSILEPTFHYRDARTSRGVAAAHARLSW